MDALSILCNALWQDALRPRRRVTSPNSFSELAAFGRQLHRAPRLTLSILGGRWKAEGAASKPDEVISAPAGCVVPFIRPKNKRP